VLINNFYGRQFNSLNDVAINPRNGEIYFTDSLYGYRQDFRPPPGIPTLVYRLNADTGAVSAVADLFDAPNGEVLPIDGQTRSTNIGGRPHILPRWRLRVRDRHRSSRIEFWYQLKRSRYYVSIFLSSARDLANSTSVIDTTLLPTEHSRTG
jgi:hypothetical protein